MSKYNIESFKPISKEDLDGLSIEELFTYLHENYYFIATLPILITPKTDGNFMISQVNEDV